MGVLTMIRIKNWMLLLCILLLLCKNSNAQTFFFKTTEASAVLNGNDLYTHGYPDTIVTWCNDWDFVSSTPTWGNDMKLKSNHAFVKFSVDNYNLLTKYQTSIDYTYHLCFTIIGYTDPQDTVSTSTSTTNSDTLMINYNNFDDNTPYQDMNLKKYSNFYKMKVIVEAILRDSAGVLVPAMLSDTTDRNFSIEGSILTQHYDKKEYGSGGSTTTPVITATAYPVDNFIDLDWSYSTAIGSVTPINYELEWTYVDDYGVSIYAGTETPIPSSSLNYDFSYNNTKVWLNSNKYRIPIIYPRGYIIYRVRAVRPDSNLFKYPVYGDWSLPGGNSGNIGSLSSGYYYISTPYMGDSINWQYTVSFAEGGKYKNVASFYDGLLKNRQSITRFNSNTNKIITTNNIYDYEGHLCIKTLPAPINATSFIYQHDVDLNSVTSLPYVAADFDTGSGTYSTIPPLATNALAGVYYSNQNPDTVATTYQKFVPDAEGYPLVQTIYDPGHNDRVSAQGGAGPKLQIGTENYIQNYYVAAMQPALNSFFGPNVGVSDFYTMMVSRDPNQQYSMVIKDYHGRQMVSALIGDGPDSSTHAITTVYTSAPDFIKHDMLRSSSSAQAVDTFSGTRTASINFFNEAHSLDSLQYYFSLVPYEACPGQFLSVKAHYSTWVGDEFGNVLFEEDTVIGNNGVGTVSTPITFSSPDGSFVTKIAPYHIQKSLAFYPWDIDASLDSFFNVANCFLTQPYFIKQSVSSAIFPCQPGSVIHDSDECSKMKWDMMQQLFPNGAYGKYSFMGDTILGSGNSIFDIIGCAADTYRLVTYFPDSTFEHCYNSFAVDGIDSMVVVYNHPTLGAYDYRCACTGITFPSICTPSTIYTTTVTITISDLNPQTKSIYVPFVPASGGMTGHYFIRSNWNLDTLNGNIMSGSTIVGTISQHSGPPHTTEIKLKVNVNGDAYYINLNAISPVGDTFLFSFNAVMSPTHTDSMHYFTDSLVTDSIFIHTNSPLCHYRYMDTCTVPTLTDTITVGGIFYANLRTMRTDSFIMVYNQAIGENNYSIAEALLPLHPQYCELKNCFVDTFKKMVLALPDWRTAQSLNLMYLDSLVAHDPLTGIMTASGLFPSPSDSLSTFTGGNIRLDSLIFINAYCSCGDSVMFQECYSGMFSYEISHHLLINNTVKNFYYNNIANLYFANRQRYVDAVLMKDGNTCSHCADARMLFEPASMILPAFFPPVSSSGTLYPDSVNVGWMSGIMSDSLQQMYDSTLLMYHSTDSALAYGSIDSIIAHLANCIAGNSTWETGIRSSLASLYNSGQAPGGNFTYSQVLHILQSNGVPLSDLCNPYIFDFSPFSTPSENNCMAPDFYTGMGSFINDSAIEGVLQSLGSVATGFSLDTVTNRAERDIARDLGNYQVVDITAAYSTTLKLYTVTVTPTGGGGGMVNIFLHSSNCGDVFTSLSLGTYTTGMDCINSLSSLTSGAPGLINQYSFLATVTPTGGTSCSMTGWMDRVPTMAVLDNSISKCIPCTQIRKLYEQFNDTLNTYSIQGADHPYYSTMLANFMNNALQEQYTSTDYETFIQSCALADSMLMPLYTGYATFKFQNITDWGNFITTLNGINTDYSFENSYCESTLAGDTITVCIDLNTVPVWDRWRYKYALSSYTGSYVSRIVNAPLSSVLQSGEIGFIYCDNSISFNPPDSSIIDTTNVKYIGPYQKMVWLGGNFVVQNFYDVVALPGTPPYEVSQDVYALSAYIFNHGINGAVFTPAYMSTVNADYFKPEKQAYLNYTYSNQQLPDYQVIEAIQEQYLTANIPSYASYTTHYSDDSRPGLFKNLYLWNASMNSRYYDTLQKIINLSDPYSGGAIFNTSNNVSIPLTAPEELTAYVCSDGSYWYRYFTTGDTLFNAYLSFPDYIPKYIRSSYRVASPVIPIPGDSLNRYFTLKVVRAGSADTIQLFGLTSFVIGKSLELDNVLLMGSPRTSANGADTFNNCERQTLTSAVNNGIVNYNNYINGFKDQISGNFRSYVVTAVDEKMFLGYAGNEHFFTLYNYDRAGNLTFTSPPAGNTPIPNGSALDTVDASRDANTPGTSPVPVITKSNNYEYDAGNKITLQQTINGGKTRFIYDVAERPVFSQNAKQGQKGSYTYNIYDAQNRIIETGEATFGCPYFDAYSGSSTIGAPPACSYSYPDGSGGFIISPDPDLVMNLERKPFDSVKALINTLDRRDVVVTIYDTVATNLGAIRDLDAQQNLRKRVSCIKYFPILYAPDTTYANYNFATHYSYDLLGNVQTLTQDFPSLAITKQQYHRIDYDYDVISGKVNMLSYNRGGPDQYYQRYSYDADNRITAVNTSADGYIFHTDARYSYYDHGPLARIDLGDLRVQGIDYAYTIQGWLKTMNSDTLNTSLDMGEDGTITSITGHDAVAYTIGYFKGDYTSISGRDVQQVAPQAKNVFNGNIAGQTMAINNFQRLTKQYVYDQQNRILSANYSVTDPVTNTLNGLTDFHNAYSYDPDGNLQTLERYGNDTGTGTKIMDSLKYFYTANTDKLYDVSDTAANNYTNDIRQYTATGTGRYDYDAIGNTIKDLVSGQDTVDWNLYNKVVRTVNNTDTSSMTFDYDGAGNRVAKHYYKTTSTGVQQRDDIYVRDAQGNVLAVYRATENYSSGGSGILQFSYSLTEHDIYGSSRLGIKNYFPMQIGAAADLTTGTYDTVRLYNHLPWFSLEYQDVIKPDSTNLYGNTLTSPYFAQHVLGLKQYELTDHLGDVLATVSDKRAGMQFFPVGGGVLSPGALATIETWKPEVVGAYDYYPFGQYMPGRYMADTATHCLTTTFTGILPAVYHSIPLWTVLRASGAVTRHPASGITLTLTTVGASLFMTTIGSGRGITYNIPLIAVGASSLVINRGNVVGGPYLFSVTDNITGLLVGSTTVSTGGAGTTTVGLASGHSTHLTIDISSAPSSIAGSVILNSIDIPRDTLMTNTIVTNVCNTDEYRYSYNGQMKVNEIAGVGNHLTAKYWDYDTRVGRRWNLDPKPNASLADYVAFVNNPICHSDVLGDSIIKVMINDRSGFIHGETVLYVDHTILSDVTTLLDDAAQSGTHISLNSSFRTNKKQATLNGKNSTTPAKPGNSTHNAGVAVDFNLYEDNNIQKGTIPKNNTVTDDDNFVSDAKEKGWRWGGDFKNPKPDPVHIDKKDKNFKKMRDANQKQMHGKENKENKDEYVHRTETITINPSK